jgi:DNA-binding GntR family transcriptional regulator
VNPQEKGKHEMSASEFDNGSISAATALDHVIFTDLDGKEGVLVDLNTRKYYQLNETAALVWRSLEKRKSIADIAAEINQLYDVPADQAALSVERLLRSFSTYQLVSLC